MAGEPRQFSHSATIFPVDDILKSAEYYRDKLGFVIRFLWGEPPEYAVLDREESVNIHLTQSRKRVSPDEGSIALYTFVYDVDKLYQEFKDRGVKIHSELDNRDYGMRDFDIKDINGYILSFGTSIERQEK